MNQCVTADDHKTSANAAKKHCEDMVRIHSCTLPLLSMLVPIVRGYYTYADWNKGLYGYLDEDDDNEFCNDGSCLDIGVEQVMPGDHDPSLLVACKERLEESEEYLLSLAEDPDTPSNIRSLLPWCGNKDEMCTYRAVEGKCETDKYSMQVECAPACFTCDKLL